MRNYGDAAAHHSTHHTYDHTHQHQRQAHQHSNTPQKQRSMEEGGDGVLRARVEDARLTGCTSHRYRAADTDVPS